MSTQETQYLKLFKDLCKKINSSLEISEVLQSVSKNTVQMLNVKGCTIYLLDEANRKLKLSSSHGLSEAYLNKGPIESEKSIVDTLSGQWVLVSDATKDQRIQYPKEAREEGITSILSVPMSVKDKIIGVLRIYTAEKRDFTEIETEFVTGLAEIGSIGIENARMYSLLKSEHDKLMGDVHHWFDFGATNHRYQVDTVHNVHD